ncbi:MAG: precorrin-6Y C5,15-methyltransferase (decarboxylating) subunit CbiT, partial [Planctomycetia bacterium]|nr:precorrin-6Y C5,15-methyltransferase (decarboxylating) subunit CbiT [Planctomycetia bacterium]
IWDIGAGLGGVSVELARAYPGLEVVSVERSPDRLGDLRANRLNFRAYNLRIVAGEAPGALIEEQERPSAVFLGGSGGRLGPILDLVSTRLKPGGRLVADFVGLENLSHCLERVRGLGWALELTQVQLNHAQPLAGLTTLAPERPVWIFRAFRPESDPPG